MDVARYPCVAEASGDGKDKGVLVANGVGVGRGVFVLVGTAAVWVRKKEADRVPMLCVSRAFISGVGEAGGCPPQETSITLMSTLKSRILPILFIFTLL